MLLSAAWQAFDLAAGKVFSYWLIGNGRGWAVAGLYAAPSKGYFTKGFYFQLNRCSLHRYIHVYCATRKEDSPTLHTGLGEVLHDT